MKEDFQIRGRYISIIQWNSLGQDEGKIPKESTVEWNILEYLNKENKLHSSLAI